MKPLLHTDRRELSGLDAHFNTMMVPELMKDESERQSRVRWGLIVAAILIPPSLWLAWYLGFKTKDANPRAISLVFSIPALGYFSVIWKLRSKSKIYILRHITAVMGWRHSRGEKACDLIKGLADFDVLPRHNTRAVDDGLEGVHLDRYFQLRELTLSKRKFTGTRFEPVLVFQGLVVSFRLERNTPDTTIISRRGHPTPARSKRGRYYFAEYEDIQGPVHILSTDHDVLNAVMCLRFRSAIADLEAAFPNTNMACLLSGDQLHVTIEAKNKFEIDWMFDAMDSPRRVQKMLDEFGDVLKLLDIVLARRRCLKTGKVDVSKIMSWDETSP